MNLKKEIPLIAIVLLPLIYLASIWNQLPEKVPVHWDINGEINRYGNKSELAFAAILLPLSIYLILLVVPKIDPKNKLNQMGNKLQIIRVLLTLFVSLLAISIVYSAKNKFLPNPNFILLSIGILFAVLGNYFKTIKSNYFIGIRTPWTLESESVWKETHKLVGKLWFTGGLAIVIFSLVFEQKINLKIFLIITAIITIVPVVYSYILFKKEKKSS